MLIGNSLGAQDGARLGAADAVGRLFELARGAAPAIALRATELEPLVRPPRVAAEVGHMLAPPLSTTAVHTFRVLESSALGPRPPQHARRAGEE